MKSPSVNILYVRDKNTIDVRNLSQFLDKKNIDSSGSDLYILIYFDLSCAKIARDIGAPRNIYTVA